MYIYERNKWPVFSWDEATIADCLAKVRYAQGLLLGQMSTLGFSLQEEATLKTLTVDALKTSEIEGEKLDAEQVRSSIAKRLGMDIAATVKADRNVEGIVDVLLDATKLYLKPLTDKRLFDWHAALFPSGRSGLHTITVGKWRTKESDPMQVVSGPYGREKIHFEAPSAAHLKKEMSKFIDWFNEQEALDLVIKAAIAHFWFVTIHPFEDGNGRIARALTDMLLARSEKSQKRFYSMSAQIQHERNAYYDVLERCQKGSLDITEWLLWFLNCLERAIHAATKTLQQVLLKAAFWRNHEQQAFNERQKLMLNRLLGEFQGKLTTSKWAKIAKCSQDTALRDITNLLDRHVLIRDEGGGRSTSYSLKLPSETK